MTYASVPDLLRFVRRGFGDGAADERLDALMQVDVLILDDLGAEYLTAWAARAAVCAAQCALSRGSGDRADQQRSLGGVARAAAEPDPEAGADHLDARSATIGSSGRGCERWQASAHCTITVAVEITDLP